MTPSRRSARDARRLAILAAGAALVLAACGGGDGTADPAADAAPEPATAPVSSDVSATAPATGPASTGVPEAIDFSAPLVGGGEIEMGEYAGRPVLLWFWAPW